MSDQFIHGTGRVPSSIPTRARSPPRDYQEEADVQFHSVVVRPNRPDEESVYRTQSVTVHSSRNRDNESVNSSKGPKVVGADIKIQRIDEKFRNKTEDTKTTVIKATRRQDEDDEDFFALDCDEVSRMIEDGSVIFRYFVIAAALFMLVGNIIDYKRQLVYNYGVNPLFIGISVYVWIFSIFVMTLELQPFRSGVSMCHRIILSQLNCLRFV